ncbi:MAG: choice-of-anchor T family protein [Thermoplasmatota archaeon]
MKRKFIALAYVLIVLIVLLSGPFPMMERAEGAGPADVSIRMNQTSMYIPTNPGERLDFTFKGMVMADIPWIPEVQSMIVLLEAEIGDWSVTVTEQLVFTKGVDELPITVVVEIPPDISGVFRLNVTGNWSYDPGIQSGECDPGQMILYVNERPDITLGCEEPLKQVQRGNGVSYEVMVVNDNDVEVPVSLTIINLADLANEDMAIQMSTSKVLVPPRNMSLMTVTVSTSTRTQTDTYPIYIHAETVDPDTGEPTGIFTEFTLYLEVVAYDPDPEPDPEPEPEPADDDGEPEPTDEDDPQPLDDESPAGNSSLDDIEDEEIDEGVVKNDQGVPTFMIFGILFGAVVFIVIFIIIFLASRKRKRLLKD